MDADVFFFGTRQRDVDGEGLGSGEEIVGWSEGCGVVGGGVGVSGGVGGLGNHVDDVLNPGGEILHHGASRELGWWWWWASWASVSVSMATTVAASEMRWWWCEPWVSVVVSERRVVRSLRRMR